MIHQTFSCDKPVILVGAGPIGASDIDSARQFSDRLIAADGGADSVLGAGFTPDAVIGDLDSLSSKARDAIAPDRVVYVREQDSTDFEKAMSQLTTPLVIGVGFTGGRIDHALAVLHGLVRFAHKPCLLLGPEEVIFHCPPDITLDLPPGAIVSLFPMAPVQGTSSGLDWPIAGLEFAPGHKIGTSNRSTGPVVGLQMQGRGMLVLIPRVHFEHAVQALLQNARRDVQWPAL